MQVKFTVLGEPRGKERPRTSAWGGKIRVYTPHKTAKYEKIICQAYQSAIKYRFGKNVPLTVKIEAYYAVPKSAGKQLREKMISGEIYPTKKPDSDNVIKAILDALNGVAFYDDTQVCAVEFVKRYSLIPHIKVEINSNKEEINKLLENVNKKIQ